MSVYIDPPKFPEAKLCMDCIHAKHYRFSGWQCHHPTSDAWMMSPVHGQTVRNENSLCSAWCENARSPRGQCKPEGKLFERKPEPIPETHWGRRDPIIRYAYLIPVIIVIVLISIVFWRCS